MIDIEGITSSTDRYNFHSHTEFCDGRVPMQTMVEAAVGEGFTHWGFSPHSPLPIASPCNMSADAVGEYIAEVECLRGIYGDRISLYAGMEIDYLDGTWNPASDYFQDMPLDYRIGSVHFIPGGDGFVDVDGSPESFKAKMHKYFDDDIRYVVDSYYDSLCAMIETGGFDIVGHLDKIGYNASCFSPGIEEDEWYCRRVNQAIDLVIDRKLIVELNTKAWPTARRRFPKDKFLPRLIGSGIKIIVNSDAHFPDRVNAGRDEGISLINSLSSK